MKIVQYPHPALRHPANPVSAIDKPLRLLAGRMLELMHEREGLGLAAPQVAVPLQLIVMNFAGENGERRECVAVNPVIVEKRGTQEGNEGCLSFPGLYQKVRRAKHVVARAYDLDGNLVEANASDLAARLWQHEFDHLHGELFIDKMGPLGKLASREELKAFEREYKQGQKRGEIDPDAALKQALADYGTTAGPIL